MILAATDPNGPSNAIATLVFWPVLIVVLIQVGRGIDWLATRTVRRHVRRALDTTTLTDRTRPVPTQRQDARP